MKTLQFISAVIELGTGLMLLSFPSTLVMFLVGVPIAEPAALTLARIGGAALLALGIACSLSYGDTQSRAARGLIAAMLVYNIAAAAVLAFAGFSFRMYGVALWPAVALHAVMTAWCVICLQFKLR